MDESHFELSDASDFVPAAKTTKAAKPSTSKVTTKKATEPKTKAKPKVKSTVPRKRTKAESDGENDTRSDPVFGDESLLNDTPPKSKKAKVTTNPVKIPHKEPLGELVNENMKAEGDSPKQSRKKRVSEQYQKLTQLEHIIKRPDTYIGSTEKTERQTWVYSSATETMEFREISYVPGLFKIFDEILVNAADNKQNDKNMDELKVTIDKERGEISVMNNGRGIPIEIHSKEKIYIPELVFGHLLSGSNYDDNEQKVTGGRNGYGAKLCNIFSTEFTVETVDSKQKKKYKQTWTQNMADVGKARITDCKTDDFTKVTFKPDFAKFGMDGLDDDHEALFKRRVYDMCGTCRGVKVSLNGSRLPIRSFKKYIELYTKAIKQERGEEAAHDQTEIITETSDPRWEIGFAVSDGSFQQVSFVNSVSTSVGGTHVNYIADQITNKLADIVKKKNKAGAQLKPNQIRNHIFVFVNCLIVNPAFSSQTKEQLTTKATQFGSKCIVSDDFIKKVAKTDVITNILSFAQQKADQILKKSDGNRRSRIHNPKLTDANRAGTKDGHLCTLVLTEGDSAKAMAMAGRAVLGADHLGCFPLRGKMLNVRDASIDQISKNVEIQNIKTFLGLQHKKVYSDVHGLRYGRLMVMTDQDHDGSHIKGLLINFLQVQFPSLLRLPGFLVEFITPIVKVYQGDPRKPTKTRAFYTMPEYDAWKEANRHDKKWEHKYYKGLGTSTTEESQEYFNDMDKHHKEFDTMNDEEASLIDLAFSKKKADERKEWLRQFKPGTYLDYSVKSITYTDFINKELILFSMADNIRSIPSVIDGLKPGQRKVLYTCFKRNLKKDMKVVELAGMVSGLTAYQHGDTSLAQTITGLAQTFVGSNNVNCLDPAGNFGSRLQGGSDAASARYIYTRLSPFARKLFHSADEPLLAYNTDDDRQIEPEIYVPIVPLVLLNGADGIGTGWSSQIPNYNPEEIVENLKRRMAGQDFLPMRPWFRGFKGAVTEAGPDRYKFSGIVKQTGDNEVEITELPIRVWTQDFIEKMEDIIKAEKVPSFIRDYKDCNTHKDVHFVVQMEEKFMKSALEEGLEEKFKLSKTLTTTNLVAFDAEGRITKYPSVEAIMEEFFRHRLRLYQQRKDWMHQDMEKDLRRYTNQARFIQMIIDGKLNISRKKKAVLIQELKKLGFDAFPKVKDASKAGEIAAVVEDDDAEDEAVPDASSFDYLLGMPLWSLTEERVEKLKKQIGDRQADIDDLLSKTKEDLWTADLDDFIAEWRFQLEDEQKRERQIRKGRRNSKKFTTGKTAVKKRKGLNAMSDEDSEFEVTKPKKATLSKDVSKAKAVTTQTKLDQFAARKPPVDELDVASGQSSVPTKKPAAPKARSVVKKVKDEPPTSDNELKVTKATTKPSRAAASKKAKYAISSDSDSDNGDDLLATLGNMVKGLPKKAKVSDDEVETTLSAALGQGSAEASAQNGLEAEPNHEDTDAELLDLPTRAAPKSKVLEMTDDDGDDEPVKPTKKTVPSKAAIKKATSSTTAKSKPAKAPPKKSVPNKVEQSPIARAYAKRLAKKMVDSENEADAMADDILSSAGVSDDDLPVARPAARPARRAAATSKKVKTYNFDDSDEDELRANGDDRDDGFSLALSDDDE